MSAQSTLGTAGPARRAGNRSPWPWVIITMVAVVLAVTFVLTPILNILIRSLTSGEGLGGWVRFVEEPKYLNALGNSLLLSALVALIATVIGVFLAYFASRYRFPGKWLFTVLPLSALIIPELIVAQAWLMLLGNNGVLTRWLKDVGIELPSVYGWPGMLLVMPLVTYPYVYLGTLAALRNFDSQLEEAATSLGASPLAARLKVTIPTILPAVLSTSILVFSLTLGNFTTATIIGKQLDLLAPLTYTAFLAEMGGDPAMQSTLATLSIAIIALVLLLQRFTVDRRRYEMVQGRSWAPGRLRGASGAVMAVLAALVLFATVLPLGLVVVMAFTKSSGPVLKWGEFSLDTFRQVLTGDPQPILNTLAFGLTACAIGVVISVVVSTIIVKKRNPLAPLLDYLVMFPQALSGTVLGIGVVMTFAGGIWQLGGTAIIIVIVLVVRRLPHGVRSASGILHSIPDSIEDAAVSLGVPPMKSYLKVVLPLMVPGIAAAAILTWVTIVGELSASLVVYSAGQETLSIKVFRLIFTGLNGQAAVYGLILCALAIVPIVIATRVFKVRLFD